MSVMQEKYAAYPSLQNVIKSNCEKYKVKKRKTKKNTCTNLFCFKNYNHMSVQQEKYAA